MKKVMVMLLVLVMAVSCLTGCGSKASFVEVPKQSDALMNVASKTADVCIIDSIMAGSYTNVGTYKGKLQIVEGLSLADENYGIGFRDGSAVTVQNVNAALYQLQENGTIAEIAKKYNLTDSLVEIPKTEMATGTDAEWEKLQNRKIIVGYTEFVPIAYFEDKELVGYDIDLASAVFEVLGIDYEFQLIDWDTKEFEIQAGSIDCVWNGFTISKDLENSFDFSVPYLANKQVAVIAVENANKIKTVDDIKKYAVVAEKGSAGAKIGADLFAK